MISYRDGRSEYRRRQDVWFYVFPIRDDDGALHQQLSRVSRVPSRLSISIGIFMWLLIIIIITTRTRVTSLGHTGGAATAAARHDG